MRGPRIAREPPGRKRVNAGIDLTEAQIFITFIIDLALPPLTFLISLPDKVLTDPLVRVNFLTLVLFFLTSVLFADLVTIFDSP